MTLTAADAQGFVYEPVRGPKRRVEYEPRSAGGFWRIESVWSGCDWRETGREPLTELRAV